MFEKEADYKKARKESKDRITKVIKVWSAEEETIHDEGFQKGAEFGYNKANGWHFIKNRDFPVRDDYYVIACHSATGDFTDRCQWLNNEWWSADGEVKHFINEKVYAWKEKSQPPKESE